MSATRPKKPTFRRELADYIQRKCGSELSSLSDVDRSIWTTRFYVAEVLSVLDPGLVPEDMEDLDDCILDGPGDAGVDFLSVQEDSVILIQSKYHGPSTIEKKEDFDSFRNILRRIHPEFGRKYNVADRVKEAAAAIDWETAQFELHFISLAKNHSEIEAAQSNLYNPLP